MFSRLRTVIMVLLDAILVNLGFIAAFYMRFYESGFPVQYVKALYELIVLSTLIYVAVFYIFKLYNRVWSYASIGELLAVIYAISVGAMGTIAASFFLRTQLPRSIIILAWAFIILLVGGSRFAWRLYTEWKRGGGVKPGRRALIVGAGEAGAMVAKELINNRHTDLRPVAFIDDDPAKKKQSLLGIPVVGNRDGIHHAVYKYNIDEIIIAMPSVGGQVLRDIVKKCGDDRSKIKVLPSIYEIIDGKVSIDRLRPVKLEDLLRRDSIRVDLTEIAGYLKGKVILVTGAGGSIGSELCRQVASFGPSRLVILGHGENSIHKIWHELVNSFPGLDLAVEIADVREISRIEKVFNKHQPSVVFHAAAHKHVPLMEMHPGEAVKTNLFGTRNVAEAAHNTGTETFILISTDKAVNPSSVMGATKRLGEVIIRQLNNRSKTTFAAVRFGNVLGSNGSVVPIFEQQIRRGGPVTVTHPEMKRYFMTIPEAVTLVIQAGTMAKGGEVFVLDMGEQVKIVDLAGEMIRLSGLEPGRDIEIVYTGIRPGEKLYEDLLTAEEGASVTRHKKIFTARPTLIDAIAFEKEIESLKKLSNEVSVERIMLALKRSIPGFTPSLQQEEYNERTG